MYFHLINNIIKNKLTFQLSKVDKEKHGERQLQKKKFYGSDIEEKIT